MSTHCRSFGRTLAAPSCTFKLYTGALPEHAVRVLHGLALTWIGDATAGFVLTEEGGSILSVYWWQEQVLHRLRCDPHAPSRRPDLDALTTVASAAELQVLAFEAACWTRHVVRGFSPSIWSYLAEFRP